MPLEIPGMHVHERLHSHILMAPLAARRQGIVWHYDDSSDDRWSLKWFQDPACKNGYTWIAMDDGRLIELADPAMRTPHAGVCKTKNANSVFYGLAAATNGKVPVTPAQLETMLGAAVAIHRFHKWGPDEVDARNYGHDEQAIWDQAATREQGIPDATARTLWGKLGRKVDPTGQRSDKRKIIDMNAVRRELAFRLGGPAPESQ